jgi:hypothetical protein
VVQLRLDGARRLSQRGGDLGHAVVLVVVQGDHLRLQRWQRPDRLPDLGVVIGELDAVLLVPNCGVAVSGLLSQVGAEEQASLVDRDLADPGPRVVEPADPIPIPVGDQEGLLGELLGHQPAPQQTMEQSHHLGILPQVERLERL